MPRPRFEDQDKTRLDPARGQSSIAAHWSSRRGADGKSPDGTKLAERLKNEGRGNPRIEGLPAADWVMIDAATW